MLPLTQIKRQEVRLRNLLERYTQHIEYDFEFDPQEYPMFVVRMWPIQMGIAYDIRPEFNIKEMSKRRDEMIVNRISESCMQLGEQVFFHAHGADVSPAASEEIEGQEDRLWNLLRHCTQHARWNFESAAKEYPVLVVQVYPIGMGISYAILLNSMLTNCRTAPTRKSSVAFPRYAGNWERRSFSAPTGVALRPPPKI